MSPPRRRDALLLVGASLVLGAAMIVAGGVDIPGWESTSFRAVNDLPSFLYPAVWPLMQFGTFVTIPIVAIAGAVAGRWRFAVASLVAGVSVYFLAKAVKLVVERGRPGALLERVELRGIGSGGIGFPSGHAAVSAALATVTVAFLPRGWARGALVLAVVVSFGRVYVGAHLPLDVIGGAALGVAVGSLANLGLGWRDRACLRGRGAPLRSRKGRA